MIPEPDITINGVPLSEPQAMTLRVALMDFLLSLANQKRLADLGEIGPLYRYHAQGISCLMHPQERP